MEERWEASLCGDIAGQGRSWIVAEWSQANLSTFLWTPLLASATGEVVGAMTASVLGLALVLPEVGLSGGAQSCSP